MEKLEIIKNENESRIVQVFDKESKEWKNSSFWNLKKGDTLRMFDFVDGCVVSVSNVYKESLWVALSDAYLDKLGIGTIITRDYKNFAWTRLGI